MTLTQDQLSIIRHSLGLDDDGHERHRGAGMYRNHYCGAVNAPELETLCGLGLMTWGAIINDGTARYYHVTDAGKQKAVEGVVPIKLTRSQRRYQDYLDHDSGMTFTEWLKFYGNRKAGT